MDIPAIESHGSLAGAGKRPRGGNSNMSKGDSSKQSVLAIKDSNGDQAGFGVYIGNRKILTCAHVLEENGVFPKVVGLSFEANGSEDFEAELIKVKPVSYSADKWHSGDVALLELLSEPPPSAVAAPLVKRSPLPDKWIVFGHPLNNPSLTEV